MTPPPRHLTLTQRKPLPPPSSYTGSEEDDSEDGSSQSPDVPECDVPIPSIEHDPSVERTADWAVHSGGSRANSHADSPTPSPSDSGTPALSEILVPARVSTVSRGRSLSDNNGNTRPSPSASPILAGSCSDGEPEIKREASEHSFWSASPRPPVRQSSGSPSGLGEPAPLPTPSRSCSRVLYPASAGSKRSRDAEDVGAGERSSQRRRSLSDILDPRRSSVALYAEPGAPVPWPSSSASGPRVLGSTSSGSKRTRLVEDIGTGDRSSQRRRTASIGNPIRRSSASLPGGPGPASLPSSPASGSRVAGSTRSSSKRSRSVEDVNAGGRSPQRRRTASTGLLEPAVAPSDPEIVVVPAEPAVDAAVTTDRAGSVDVVVAPALPVTLAVVAVVNIIDIEPAAGPADAAAPVAAVANPVARPAVVAVVNPGPLPDRAEVRFQARLDVLFTQSRDLPRAQRSAMVSSFPTNLTSSFFTNSFTAKIARIVALARRATPGLPGSGACLRIPRHRVKVRCLLRLRRLKSASGTSSDVVSPLRSPSWAWALTRCLRPRGSQSSDARFRYYSTLALLSFASTADAPRCHHFARLFLSASARCIPE